MNQADVLIVGHGIAGAVLGWYMEQRGLLCHYIDAPDQQASSTVAAGIINPITGRYFVKSWMIDELLPEALHCYQAIGQHFGQTLLHEQALLRSLSNAGEENDWLARSADPQYAPYLSDEAALADYAPAIHQAYAYGQVRQAAQVDVHRVCALLAEERNREQRLWKQTLDYAELTLTPSGVLWNNTQYRYVCFCEGWRQRFNPFFNHPNLQGNKGEALLVNIPGLYADRIIKQQVFIVPYAQGSSTYWVGGTSSNQFSDEAPTAAGRKELETHLQNLLKLPYDVLWHRAAIRPTVKTRRPMLGKHPEHPALVLFNGLGTKGTSLAPFWAKQLCEHLLDNAPLHPQVAL